MTFKIKQKKVKGKVMKYYVLVGKHRIYFNSKEEGKKWAKKYVK